jgi:hypothetical protein
MAMNKAQRFVLILYCLLLAYCCAWIPWHSGNDYIRLGYGWLWSGPSNLGERTSALATPDLAVIFLRILTATSISAAAFLIVGTWTRVEGTRL